MEWFNDSSLNSNLHNYWMSHIELAGNLLYEYSTTCGLSFVCFDALHFSQSFFSHVGMILSNHSTKQWIKWPKFCFLPTYGRCQLYTSVISKYVTKLRQFQLGQSMND